jgi:hypothetical protein
MRKIHLTTIWKVFIVLAEAVVLNSASVGGAESAAAVSGSEKPAWQGGFNRYDYVMDGATLEITPLKAETADSTANQELLRGVIVAPKKPLPGNPWSWKDYNPMHFAESETELLERGYYVVYTTPGSIEQQAKWRAFLIGKYGLSKKPVHVGMSHGTLLAGTAKISITPENTKLPVHDPVQARVLVLEVGGERLAFISMDLGVYYSDRLIATCKEKFGISQVVMSSSHTHSDPGHSYSAFYDEQVVQAMGSAVSNMFPAKISAGFRSFPQLGFNRLVPREDGHTRESWHGDDHYRSENPDRIPFGPVDPEVGVIKIEDADGQPRAIIMNYACHADVVCQNYAISADYPGVACRKVEEAFDNKVNCLFVQGAGGNIESLIISSRRNGPDDPFQTDYSTIDRVGFLLAYETVKLAKSLKPNPSGETKIRYMNDALKFTGRFEPDREFDVRISTILINDDIVIATVPGEPFIQFQLDWKKKMEGVHAFLFGYTWYEGTWPDYIADIQSAATGGYGADQGPPLIEVGAGEAIMAKHLENTYRLSGLMREEPGPTAWTPGDRWIITPVPRSSQNGK